MFIALLLFLSASVLYGPAPTLKILTVV